MAKTLKVENVLVVPHMREGRKNIHMRGIWAGKGFEKIDVKKEIKSLRKDISKSILKKGK